MKHIPLMMPYVTERAAEAVREVLKTRWIGQGPRVDEFERLFSQKIVLNRPCLAVGSCTDALHLSYLLAGIGPGDEVIAPVFTCTATNIPLLYLGANIKFCDVAPGSLNMSVDHARQLVSNRTRAIVTVHYGGAPVNAELFHLANFFDLPIIEDCAQAIGPRWAGVRGDFACFSFQAVKHVTTGDGGMLVLPQPLYERARRMRWFGIDRAAKLNGTWANDISDVGFKYQMTDIAAAMGIAGLESLDEQIKYRRELRTTYIHLLQGVDGINLIDMHSESACWLCTVVVERREDLRRRLADEGIESDLVHYRNDRYSIFRDSRGEFPNMDMMDARYLVLPLHMGMRMDDVRRVCDVIRGGW